jgi:uncharacterized protein (UPF0297 family)
MSRDWDETDYRLSHKEIIEAARDAREQEIHQVLGVVMQALEEKGYDPLPQLIGYLLTEDPIYITSHNDARKLICRLDRFEVMTAILKKYYNK